jgi:hypothetical protein
MNPNLFLGCAEETPLFHSNFLRPANSSNDKATNWGSYTTTLRQTRRGSCNKRYIHSRPVSLAQRGAGMTLPLRNLIAAPTATITGTFARSRRGFLFPLVAVLDLFVHAHP